MWPVWLELLASQRVRSWDLVSQRCGHMWRVWAHGTSDMGLEKEEERSACSDGGGLDPALMELPV